MKSKQIIAIITFIAVCTGLYFWRNHRYKIISTYYPQELVYKINDEKQHIKLDVYRPDDTLQRYKTILYFHGGSWFFGTKHKVLEHYRNYVVKSLLERDIQVISVDYTLITLLRNEFHLEDCIKDCSDAVNYCFENASYLKIDTSNVGFWGSSAGGHLAMMNLAPSFNNHQVKFIIDDFGPADIHIMWRMVTRFFRRQFSTIFFKIKTRNAHIFDSLAIVHSPIYYVDELKTVPILISHGSNDKVVNPSQSRLLHDSLPNSSDFYFYQGLRHGFKTMDSAEIKEYNDRLMMFLATKF